MQGDRVATLKQQCLKYEHVQQLMGSDLLESWNSTERRNMNNRQCKNPKGIDMGCQSQEEACLCNVVREKGKHD